MRASGFVVLCAVVLASQSVAGAGTSECRDDDRDILECDLGGTVYSWQCCQDTFGPPYFMAGIESVLVHYEDTCTGPLGDACTNEYGDYCLSGLPEPGDTCSYCLSVEFGGTPPRPPIRAFDAHLVLNYTVCLDGLDNCPFEAYGAGTVYPQVIAADVNCNGIVTAYDASLILQYRIGKIPAFPCPEPYKFYSLSDPCVSSCAADVDWVGILIGDLTPYPCEPGTISTDTVFAKLEPPSYYGNTVEVPIGLVDAEDVFSLEFGVAYDTDNLILVSVTAEGAAAGYFSVWDDDGGDVSIAATGAGGPIEEDTVVVMMTFHKDYPEEEICGYVTLESAFFNEGLPPAGVIDYCGRDWHPITSITDVGNDQGRNVRIRWRRAWHDDASTDTSVTSYSILRRVDQNLLAACSEESALLSGVGYPPGEWEFVKSVPAWGEDTYTTVCETLCDSTAGGGICWSVFFIRAETDVPSVFFDGAPDSGYSVDNLAPSPPPNLIMASYAELAWEEVPDGDLDYYSVYGSDNMVPGGDETLLGYTAGLHMDVSGDIYAYYHVTGTDFSGNEGEASSVANTYAGVPAGRPPDAFALRQNMPNPFESSTLIGFDLPERAHISLAVYDVGGELVRVLAEEEWPAGRHSVAWDGVDGAGARVAPGIYFTRMEAGRFAEIRKMILLR